MIDVYDGKNVMFIVVVLSRNNDVVSLVLCFYWCWMCMNSVVLKGWLIKVNEKIVKLNKSLVSLFVNGK